MINLQKRLERDQKNAEEASIWAGEKLDRYVSFTPTSFAMRYNEWAVQRARHESSERASLRAIVETAFHAMAEVVSETRDGGKKKDLWYANKETINNIVLTDGVGGSINVLSWTHPGIQMALSGQLGEPRDVWDGRYTLVGVTATARAKFTAALPAIIGIYEPGGSVGERQVEPTALGLKAVKLDMTAEQVKAFISKMDGIMFVTGAPGSGKTTVALQRVRFLYDQQGLREDHESAVKYYPEVTKVFLANPNLIEYTKNLLRDQMKVPFNVVALVPEFIGNYLADVWAHKHNARPQTRKYASRLETRAREAFFSLCVADDLARCWGYFEQQISDRLAAVEGSYWFQTSRTMSPEIQTRLKALAERLVQYVHRRTRGRSKVHSPLASTLRMDRVYEDVDDYYERVRESYGNKKQRESFDEEFAKWLFYVYDPIDCLRSFFGDFVHEGKLRIRDGTGARIDENSIVSEILDDLSKRAYRKEEEPWLAWLLRFGLPEEGRPEARFRRVPSALSPVLVDDRAQWTHVVIDEAQDLSVPEASLVCSFVDPKGALTISSDFHQIVSPVHGMPDAEAFKYGCPILDRSTDSYFPFSKNMRQTKQISAFLRAFYYQTFHEPPPFVANDALQDIKPILHITKPGEVPTKVRQIFFALQRSPTISTIALLQVNEDEDELMRLRSALERAGVPLASAWEPYGTDHTLVTTSVERVKGLEYDCCLILGLDNVELSALKYSVNRAYVALSRPTRRLAIFCETFPKILRGIDRELFDTIQ